MELIALSVVLLAVGMAVLSVGYLTKFKDIEKKVKEDIIATSKNNFETIKGFESISGKSDNGEIPNHYKKAGRGSDYAFKTDTKSEIPDARDYSARLKEGGKTKDDYYSGTRTNVNKMKSEVENVNTNFSELNEHDESVIYKGVYDALYSLLSKKYIAEKMLEGIYEDTEHFVFNSRVLTPNNDSTEFDSPEEYILAIKDIIDISDQKYTELKTKHDSIVKSQIEHIKQEEQKREAADTKKEKDEKEEVDKLHLMVGSLLDKN